MKAIVVKTADHDIVTEGESFRMVINGEYIGYLTATVDADGAPVIIISTLLNKIDLVGDV